MGFFRRSGLVLVMIILFVSLLCVGIFATLNFSLNHKNVQEKAQPIIVSSLETQVTNLDQLQLVLTEYCKTHTEYSLNGSLFGSSLVIPCNLVSQGTQAILYYEAGNLIDQIYYKQYSCEFFDCFGQQKDQAPLFLISEHAKDFFKKQFYTFLLISLFLMFLMFLLVKNRFNFFILIGVLLIFSFIPVLLLSNVATFALSNIGSDLPFDISSIVLMFFSKATIVFLTALTLGLILIGFGILLKVRLGNKAGYRNKNSNDF